ncbi:unnamed protein product [Ectocarpus sp. CCAP 1310/34]|nr:unnamed protein product [Ectocarpus sp. CCAP 1310/34]
MPCAEGELCAQQDKTPQAPHGHPCKGGCGNCGSMFGDNEQHRICSACVAKDGKRKAPAADTGGRGQSKRPKVTNGGNKKFQPSRKGPRARPDLDAKLEMLKLMDAKVTHEQIADRFACSVLLVRDVKKSRQKYARARPDLDAKLEMLKADMGEFVAT